ncbi:MAG: hypothetical protein MJE66_15335 [Proteobacteria bacterium]|nr:hypothetical protein [Pseudomonadota bacterium]
MKSFAEAEVARLTLTVRLEAEREKNARLRAEVETLGSKLAHDRETLEQLENAFEAVGADLVESVLGLRNAAAGLQRWIGGTTE